RALRAWGRARALRAARRGGAAALLARRLGREVRRAQRRALEARPTRARAEERRPRAAALRADREFGPRGLALLAAARDRRRGLAVHADRGVRLGGAGPRGVLERRRRGLRRAGREVPVRL